MDPRSWPMCLGRGQSNAVLGYYTFSARSIDVGAWLEDVARKLLAVVVDAKGRSRCLLHRRCGLIRFQDQPTRLFLPVAVIEQLLG